MIATGVSIPLLCLEGVPDLSSAPKDEAGLTRKFETNPGLRHCGQTWFFSSFGGILELRRGFQASSWVGPGKPNLPLGLQGKAGGCARERKRRLDSLEAAQGAPRDPRRDSRGERSLFIPFETRPDSPGVFILFLFNLAAPVPSCSMWNL